MRCLVTGGRGFIGTYVVQYLKDAGHVPILFEEFGSSDRIDAVIHLAGRGGIPPELQDPVEQYREHVTTTVDLLEFCERHEVRSFVMASSSAVYGNGRVPCREEDDTNHPLCHYAATKKAAELACFVAYNKTRMNVACLRLFTVYGPGQKTKMAVPLLTERIINGDSVTVYDSGTSGRDYVYVTDAANAFVKALELNRGYNAYNIGTGRMTSNLDLVNIISECVGKKPEIQRKFLPYGYAACTCADINKAQDWLAYHPKVNIYAGLRNYIDWYKGAR